MVSAKPSPSGRPAVTLTPAEEFRAAIGAALAQGADASAMQLHLTLRDESSLRRDRTVPLEDIRYMDGEMRFLGVKVTSGATSALVITSA
jgi:hypothetical protein